MARAKITDNRIVRLTDDEWDVKLMEIARMMGFLNAKGEPVRVSAVRSMIASEHKRLSANKAARDVRQTEGVAA